MKIFLLYALIWLIPLNSSYWFLSDFNVGLSNLASVYLLSFIFISFFSSLLMSIIFFKKPSIKKIIEKFDEQRSIDFQSKIVALWFMIFLVEIIYSGGVPAFWGGQRGYSEFGIPMIHGFSNMLRGLIFSNLILFFIFKFNVPKYLIVLSVLTLLSSLILEQSRGAFVITLAFGLGPIVLFLKFSLKKILQGLIVLSVLIPLFSIYQFIRYADSPISETAIIVDLVKSDDQAYKYLLEPIFNYIATPVLNAGLNIDIAPLYKFSPINTLQPLVPSTFRHYLFANNQAVYGELINEAFNTTTFVTPFVQDFGLIGGFLFISAFIFFAHYVYAKARHGSLWHIIAFPALIMCLVLSIFSSYLTSLVTIVYLILTGITTRRMMRL